MKTAMWLISNKRIISFVCLGFILPLFTFAQIQSNEAQTDPSAPATEGQFRQIMELETQINALLVRRAADRANVNKNTIPPANNTKDVKAATFRIVRGDMSVSDIGNLRYGTTFVFACSANNKGSFTAYGFTAAHVLYPNGNFIDTGGAYNINPDNAQKKGVVSFSFDVLAQEGGSFDNRSEHDTSFKDAAVIKFDVAACPQSVISIKSFIGSGEQVIPTGFPYTSPNRTLTQNSNCSMRSDGSAQPCKINGVSVRGYSGGPITARDGQVIGISSAADGQGLILADNTQVMRSMVELLCRTTKERFYYYVDKKKIDCPA